MMYKLRIESISLGPELYFEGDEGGWKIERKLAISTTTMRPKGHEEEGVKEIKGMWFRWPEGLRDLQKVMSIIAPGVRLWEIARAIKESRSHSLEGHPVGAIIEVDVDGEGNLDYGMMRVVSE